MTGAVSTFPPYRRRVLVVQPLPGIGDMVWHLPHIRAIAAQAGAPVTVLAKPRSLADQLLSSDPAVSDVQWVDLNPGGRRGAHDGVSGFLRLTRMLRRLDVGTCVFLHHSTLLAAAAWQAGIPDRRGYGWGRQRWLLNNGPFLPPEVKTLHQHTRATRYLEAACVTMRSNEPSLAPTPAARSDALARLGLPPGGYVAVGIGSSEVLRQWGAQRFGELVVALLDAGWPAVVLLGGAEDEAAARIIASAAGARAASLRPALGWNLAEVIGVLSQAAFYVGNNTGVMNIAAATGTRTYALFGTTRPFDHASQIVPVTAADLGVHDGMARVTTAMALDAILADRGRIGP